MAVSPADFYAYSRATGVQIPDDPYERAQLVPEVKAFRQNQLRAPQQEQPKGADPLSVGLGLGLALAGGAAGFLGTKRLLKGPAKSATAGVRQVDLGDMTDNLATAKRFRYESAPATQQAKPEPSRIPDNQVFPAQEVDVAQDFINKYQSDYEKEKRLETGRMTQGEMRRQQNVVDQVEQEEAQAILAGLASQPETKMVRRHGRMVPREENLQRPVFSPRSYIEDIGSISPPEDLTSVQQQDLPQVIDQKINAVESGEDQITGRVLRRAQIDTDFVKFSQQAEDISKRSAELRNISDQVNQFDEQLENLGLQNKQYQGSINQPRKYTAEDLTGMFRDPITNREFMASQGGRRIGMTNAEIRDRVMAAASSTLEQEQMLLNPDVPTSQVRHLLGTTGRAPGISEEAFTNPTFEVRGSAATTPKASATASAEEAQKFFEQGIGTGTVGFTAVRRTINPEYSNRLSKFKNEWDELSNQGLIAPRRTLVDGAEYTYQQMKELVEQEGFEVDRALYDRSGSVLRDLAQSLGLSDVPETITTLEQGPVLREVRSTRERTATGTSPIVGGVEQTSGTLAGSERQERTSEGAVPLRVTKQGQESAGVYATKDEERPFHLVPTEVKSTGLIGGYQTNVPLPVFNFDSVRIGDRGQMVPMQQVQGTYGSYVNPIGRMQQLSDVKPARFYSGASEILDVQPFMLTNLQTQIVGGGKGKGAVPKQFVVNEPVYGQLLARNEEGKLIPATLNKEKVTGKVRKLAEQFANEDPLERGGLIADALYDDLLTSSQLDLPVLKDPAAGRQFVNDLLNIESDVQQYGRPATGRVTTRSKDPLRNQKFAVEYIEGKGYAESVPLTTRRTYGLGGVNPMETDGGEIAAFTPRIENVMTATLEEARRRRGIVR
jgi:hypothetical protein